MKRATRSYFLALRASNRFGRAVKLRDAGKLDAAAKAACEALAIMAHPHVVRSHPTEAAVIASATVFLEGLPADLATQRARYRDIVDTLDLVRTQGLQGVDAEWLPYLEHRAAHWNEAGAGLKIPAPQNKVDDIDVGA